MSKLLNFILWPALAGVIFAAAVLVTPSLLPNIPAFSRYQAATQEPAATKLTPEPPAPAARASYSDAIKKSAPAVVSINAVNATLTTTLRRNLLGSYLEMSPEKSNSLGSGVIISVDGYIVTSAHIFDEKSDVSPEITITLADGAEFEGALVAVKKAKDLALIKVYSEGVPFLSSINSVPDVGDVVLAIGNPRNIGQSVSLGIVSALWRRNDSFVIQTDAAINPGNSGGALVDAEGNLIGINSTIVSESGGSEGISFAIPASEATKLLMEYLASGPSGYLGVNSSPLTLAAGRKLFNSDIQGLMVTGTKPNSPAAKSGLKNKDVITAVNDQKIVITDPEDPTEMAKAVALISKLKPGEEAKFEIYRDNLFSTFLIVLAAGEPQIYATEKQN
jgi:S1-C subfamily serine protease